MQVCIGLGVGCIWQLKSRLCAYLVLAILQVLAEAFLALSISEKVSTLVRNAPAL